MERRTKLIGAGALAAAAIAATTGFALANGADDDRPLSGSSLDRATRAALQATGGGTVLETEVGDDGAAYGVEIRLEDGRVVEVALDDAFHVVGTETDEDTGGEGNASDDA